MAKKPAVKKSAKMPPPGMPLNPMMGEIKTTGTFQGQSNKLGFGGRAAQLRAKGVPGGVIGNLARAAGAAPGGPNYHGPKAKGKGKK